MSRERAAVKSPGSNRNKFNSALILSAALRLGPGNAFPGIV